MITSASVNCSSTFSAVLNVSLLVNNCLKAELSAAPGDTVSILKCLHKVNFKVDQNFKIILTNIS